MATAVVIGGGISGLSASYYLQKSSRFAKIIVVEGSARVGGWMHTVTTDDGAHFELGPRSIRPFLAEGHNTLLLAEELGLASDIIGVPKTHPASKNRYIYSGGQLNALPNTKFSVFKSNPPIFPQPPIRMLRDEIFKAGKSVEDESVHSFISRRFGEHAADYLVDPMCRGIFAGDCRKMSVKSCFRILYDVEQEYGSIIKGFALKGIKKQTSSKKEKPLKPCKVYDQANTEQWASYSFKHGTQQLPDRIEEAVNGYPEVEIIKNSPCSEISIGDGVLVVNVNGEKIKADRVVSSIYAGDLAKLLPPSLDDLRVDLAKIPAVDTVVACVEFEGHHEPPSPGFGHLLPSKEDGKVLGVIYDSCTFPSHDRTDQPSTRYTVMMGGAWFAELEQSVPSLSKEDLGRLATDTLRKQLGLPHSAKPSRIEVAHLRNCIPQYIVGHDKLLDNIYLTIRDARLPLSLVGSSYKGPSVNSCINNTRLEIERITGARFHEDIF